MDIGIIKATAKKYPLGTVATGVLVVMLALYFVRYSSAAELKASLEANNEESQRHSANISYSVLLEDHLRALVDANRTINSRLVNPQDLALTLEYFYKLERETGVKLLDTRPASQSGRPKVASKAGFRPVQYAVSLQGSFGHVLTFLRRLEQGSYYCRVLTATCNPAQEDSSAKNASAEIILSLTIEILGKA